MFRGFQKPEQNWCMLPNQFIDLLPSFSSMSEMKCVLYILRHTWGFQQYDSSKMITLDEFVNGRKRGDGTRIDAGTGLSRNSVIQGLKRAESNGFILSETDASDKARTKKYYIINSGVQKLNPEVQKLHPRGAEVAPRTEKETIERNLGKESPPPRECLIGKKDGFFSYEDAGTSTGRVQSSKKSSIVAQMREYGIPPKDFVKLVNCILEHHKLKTLVDRGLAEKELMEAQEAARDLVVMDESMFRTTDGIDSIFADWRSDPWRNENHPLPSMKKMVDHARAMLTKIDLASQRQADDSSANTVRGRIQEL